MKKKYIIICVFAILIAATVGYYLGKQSHGSSIIPLEERIAENVNGSKKSKRVVNHNSTTSLERKATENVDDPKGSEWGGVNSRDEILNKIINDINR